MFKHEVQEKFSAAGWFEGRTQAGFQGIEGFEKFPGFLKSFLYEYGGLVVETRRYEGSDVQGTLNFNAIAEGYFLIGRYLTRPAYYGNQFTFPIAYYDTDHAVLECDTQGRIYMSGDFPCLMSNNFIEGIEKVIMEDYNDTLKWNPEINQWVDEY